MRIVLFLLSGFLAYAPLSLAQEASPLSIKISGNERTRTPYIKKLVEDCLNKTESPRDGNLDQTTLKQCLLNSRLFVDVQTSVENDTLLVTVDEKWTLIPLPVATAGSGDSRSAGLFVFESNFLGMGMLLAGGAAVSNTGTTYFGTFSDPSIAFSNSAV